MTKTTKTKTASANLKDAMATVTNQVIAAMEQHGTDWVKPWAATGNGIASGLPRNVSTGKAYRGINVWLLSGAGFGSNLWGTFKQWQDKGATVTKGSKASRVYLWKPLEVKDDAASEATGDLVKKTIWMVKEYCVFNAEQVDGFEAPQAPIIEEPQDVDAIDHPAFEAYIAATGAKRIEGDSAYYHPTRDLVCMPPKATFKGSDTSGAFETYYSTLAHEFIHWTGGSKRLDRIEPAAFGSEKYAFEELVAELGAVFLTIQFGINTAPRPDHAKYLNSWIKALKNDKRMIFSAASKAQAAVDHLDGYIAAPEFAFAAE